MCFEPTPLMGICCVMTVGVRAPMVFFNVCISCSFILAQRMQGLQLCGPPICGKVHRIALMIYEL